MLILKMHYFFVGVRLSQGLADAKKILRELTTAGYQVADLSDDEMANTCALYGGGRLINRLRAFI